MGLGMDGSISQLGLEALEGLPGLITWFPFSVMQLLVCAQSITQGDWMHPGSGSANWTQWKDKCVRTPKSECKVKEPDG